MVIPGICISGMTSGSSFFLTLVKRFPHPSIRSDVHAADHFDRRDSAACVPSGCSDLPFACTTKAYQIAGLRPTHSRRRTEGRRWGRRHQTGLEFTKRTALLETSSSQVTGGN